MEGQIAAWLWSKGWYESKSARDLFLFLSLSFRLSDHFLMSRWCCRATAKGKYDSAWQGQEWMPHSSLYFSLTHTHNSRTEPWAGCCKSPEILLDFLFSSDSKPFRLFALPLSISDIAFLQTLVMKLGGGGTTMCYETILLSPCWDVERLLPRCWPWVDTGHGDYHLFGRYLVSLWWRWL